jgi:CheY-like chemotaxis protein
MVRKEPSVLLVIADDDAESAEGLAELLRLLVPPPVEIVLAYDGEEALVAATTGATPADAVIMDIEMPRMNGIDAAVAIRRSLPKASTALIAITGHSGRTLLASASNAFDHVLLKPLDVQELLPLLPLPADGALRSPSR